MSATLIEQGICHEESRVPVRCVPVDPGDHELSAEAAGYVPIRRTVTLAEGQTFDVDLVLTPVVAPAPALADAKAPLVETAAPEARAIEVRVSPRAARRATLRNIGIGMSIVGIATISAAGVLGLLTKRKVSDAAPYCAADFSTCFDVRGLNLLADARTLQSAALTALGAGVVLTMGGAAFYFTNPPRLADPPSAPQLAATIGPLGATVRGAW